jgi:type II secretory pathway component GspD/PulD (secretin)
MKTLLLVLALLCPVVFAVPVVPQDKAVTLSFDKVPLVTLANVVYGDILKQNFAIHPDLVRNETLVSFHFQSEFDKVKLYDFMENLLAGVGIVIQKKPGYLFLVPAAVNDKADIDEAVFYYRPQYRPVSYIVDLTSSIFKTGRFTGRRSGIRAPAEPHAQGEGQQPHSQGAKQPVMQKPIDSGTSAYSMQDKGDVDAFIFQGTEKEIAQLQKLLVQVDIPTGEVMVKGIVYEVTTGQKEGSAFTLALSILGGRFGVNVGKAIAGDSFTIKTPSIDAVFSALATDSRFKSVSSAFLRVKSGATARFSVGSDVPVLGAVQIDRNGNPVQSVEYKPSGVIFDLMPQIRSSTIDLTINQQLSSFIPTTTGVNNSPTLIKRELSTTIGAENDDVIVLGGLDDEKNSQDNSGLSFLPAFLKSRGGESAKTEILLVLHVKKI